MMNGNEQLIQNFLMKNISQLKEKRSNYFSGLCPFHMEKSSSFFVDLNNGLFKCFGCNKGGTVNFLLKTLGNTQLINYQSNIQYQTIKRNSYSQDIYELRHQILLDIVSFCKRNLTNEAINFLKQRGFSYQKILKAEIGFSAPGLISHLIKTYSAEQIEQFAFFRKSEGGKIYFTLFNKIIFPIYKNGTLVSLSGRSINEKSYINLPNDEYYSKSECFYYVNQLLNQDEYQEIYLTEGYFDVLSLYKKNKLSLGVMGSSLSAFHIKELQQLQSKGKTIISCFDLDEPGMKAALQLSQNVNIEKFASFHTKDIDESIRLNRKINYLTRAEFLNKYRHLISPTNLIYLRSEEKIQFYLNLINKKASKYAEQFEYDPIVIYCSLQIFYEREILKLKRHGINMEILEKFQIYSNSFLLKKVFNSNEKLEIQYMIPKIYLPLQYFSKMVRIYQTRIHMMLLEKNLPDQINLYIEMKNWLMDNLMEINDEK